MERKYLWIGIIITAVGFLGAIATSLVIIGMGLLIYGKLLDIEKSRPKPSPQQLPPQKENKNDPF